MLTELDDTVWPPSILNSARINEWRNAGVDEEEEDLFDAIRDGNYEVVKKQLDEDIEKVVNYFFVHIVGLTGITENNNS